MLALLRLVFSTNVYLLKPADSLNLIHFQPHGVVGTSACLPPSPSTIKAAAYRDCHFKHIVERLWYLLDTVGSTLKINRSEYIKGIQIPSDGIYGVDFKELLEVKGPEKATSIRYIKTD